MKIFQKILQILGFLLFYVRALISANLRIALDVITPGLRMCPGFIQVPLRTRSDLELLVFSNLVTMTPGTLSLDVSPDRRFLYVHGVYFDDPEAARRLLEVELQERVLKVLRW